MKLSLSQDVVPSSVIIDESLPSIEFTPAQGATIKVIEESDARLRLNEEIRQLSLLDDGWDYEAAKKPSRLALRNASLLLSSLDDSVLPHCSFFPSNDAGIYFQGNLAKGRLTVFINDEMMAYVVKGGKYKLSASVSVSRESIEYLNIGLKEYV